MNREKLQARASEWTRVAKNDIRTKINDFMRENDVTPRELAYLLAISDGELQQILNGNGELTLSTFVKILIASGHAVEIKPIEETPIGSYDNIPQGPMPPLPNMRHNPFGEPTMSRHPIFDRPMTNRRQVNERPRMDEPTYRSRTFGDIPPRAAMELEDRFGSIMPPRIPRPERPTPQSPFDTMSREKMIDIIRKRLWDSEIDVYRVPTKELAEFLKDKDRRMKQNKEREEIENDPKVADFKERLKKTVKKNPHLLNMIKSYIGDLED